MNHSTDNPEPDSRVALDVVARAFEKRWHKDHSFVVEQFLESIMQLLHPLGIDASKPAGLDAFRRELIHLEMDLRCAYGYPVVSAEYFKRFREIPAAVEEALARARRLYPQCFRDSVVRTTNTRIGEGSESADSLWTFDAVGHAEVPSRLGPYRAITYIGSGGFGDVYQAIDSRCEETVALKFPRHRPQSSSDEMEQVKAEARLAMLLKHPGIVATRAIENIDSFAFIVQDFIHGMNLKMFMEGPDLDQRDIGMLIAQVADALAYAHREGVIHRDIKPQNILVDKGGKPFVADFGLAIYSSQRYGTIGQPVCGTKYYFSPEVVSGRMYQVGGSYDVWSLGIVFYQLLTGQRPFGGPSDRILFEEIVQKDPEPPHVLNPRVDLELDRICLQCLEKKPGRRLSARKLADSLQAWLKQPPAIRQTNDKGAGPAAKFVPRGLHSYTARDARFFLPLLPGPRDEHNIPASIRFWRDRILEPVAQEDRVPVGVIYGPSGSGKSSYVKAGLIPLIGHQVRCIYVESTHKDTDVRLLKALRHEFDTPSGQFSLPEIFAGLREGKWQRGSRTKILICLDQFEQRLSAVGEFDPTELINALRHCDGEYLQCLLLVRDDFLMSMSRFADALEMDLREGQNTQIVDLFDRKHARKVLTMLGHAYDRLSTDKIEELSEEEADFVNRAVDDQVEDQRVICVRLTVFAEMFKNQSWSVANLQEAGSVTGVGVQFLDRELGPQNRKVPHEAVFRLLCSLLPAAGTDIRGSMKSKAELALAAGLAADSTPFKKIIALLDNELRLITRTDPDVSGEVEANKDNTLAGDRYFQLTHDYLVPSIRTWQDKWLGGTRRGRAELRLQRLASEVVPGKKPENLPTHLEWLAWQLLLRRHRFTASEKVVMKSARRRFFKDASLAAMLLILVGGLISWAWIWQRREAYANDLVHRIKGLNHSELPGVVGEMADYRGYVLPKLQKALDAGTDDHKRRVRLSMLGFDDQFVVPVVNDVTRADCGPAELQAAIQIFRQTGVDCKPVFSRQLSDSNNEQAIRFRSAIALICLDDNPEIDWDRESGLLATMLIREPLSSLDGWIAMMAPAGGQLRVPFEDMLESTSDSGTAFTLASAIHEFCGMDAAGKFLADNLIDSDAIQFDAILDVFERHQNRSELLKALEAIPVQDLDDRAMANRALAMFRLGNSTPFLDALGETRRPAIRSYAMIRAVPPRIDFDWLQNLHSQERVQQTPLVRQGVMLAIAEQLLLLLDPAKRDWATQHATEWCLAERDAGCFAAAELILRRTGKNTDDLLRLRKRRLQNVNSWEGNIYINKQYMAFSVLDIPGDDSGRKLAVGMTELTKREFAQWPEFSRQNHDHPDLPFVVDEVSEVYQYCAWLDSQDPALSEDKPVVLADIESAPSVASIASNNARELKREGYRLTAAPEWLSMTNTEMTNLEFMGIDRELGNKFAWTLDHVTEGNQQRAGLLLPLPNGLFDLYGNAPEICSLSRPGLLSTREKTVDLTTPEAQLEIDTGDRKNVEGTLYFLVGGHTKQKVSLLSSYRTTWIFAPKVASGLEPGVRLVRLLKRTQVDRLDR